MTVTVTAAGAGSVTVVVTAGSVTVITSKLGVGKAFNVTGESWRTSTRSEVSDAILVQ